MRENIREKINTTEALRNLEDERTSYKEDIDAVMEWEDYSTGCQCVVCSTAHMFADDCADDMDWPTEEDWLNLFGRAGQSE